MALKLLTAQLTISCIVGALLLSPSTVTSSAVDVFENEATGEVTLTVTSSKPETTFSGVVKLVRNRGSASSATLRNQFIAGEEFCIFIPALGKRNLTAFAHALNYWDPDVEFEVSDSEGSIIDSKMLIVQGKRAPYAIYRSGELVRPDIFRLCIRNKGSAKTIVMGFHQTQQSFVDEFAEVVTFLKTANNISTESLSRIESLVFYVTTLSKAENAVIIQDYHRLRNTEKWINLRGIAGSLAMLFCSFMSTTVIRRWFNNSRTSV